MKLALVGNQSGVLRLASSDEITMLDFTEGANPLDPILGPAGYTQIVLLDLAHSTYMDSTGVGWLLQCNARFQRSGGRLVLHSLAPMVCHCLRVLGLQEILNTAADDNAALLAAGAPAPVPSAP